MFCPKNKQGKSGFKKKVFFSPDLAALKQK